MNPVMIDWLNIVLGLTGCVLLVLALVKSRSAVKAGHPVPPSAKAMQGVAVTCVLILALMNLVGNS